MNKKLELKQRLLDYRNRAIQKNMKLLTKDEVIAEVDERRGDCPHCSGKCTGECKKKREE